MSLISEMSMFLPMAIPQTFTSEMEIKYFVTIIINPSFINGPFLFFPNAYINRLLLDMFTGVYSRPYVASYMYLHK